MVSLGAPTARRQKQHLVQCGATTIFLICLYTLFPPHDVRLLPIVTQAYQTAIQLPQRSSYDSVNVAYLDKHHLSPQFSFRRRTIKTKKFIGERPDLTLIHEPLFDAPYMLDSRNLTNVDVKSLPPLTLPVPASPIVDTSILTFGVATRIPRLRDSVPQFQHWLADTSCPLHVLTPPHDDDLIIEREIRAKGINLTITPSTLPFANAYFSLIKQLYDTRSSNTNWLVLIDDDTFIPSLPALVQHLSSTYDESKEILISALSDDLDQIRKHGLIPFGGGGIFISIPLASRLTQPDIWEKCLETGASQGDQILDNCLNQHTNVRPTFDSMLNQMDIVGGEGLEAGYFESGRRFLTIHHWKSWFYIDLPRAALVSKASGLESIFQRYLFPDDIILSSGYSVAEYSHGATGNMEKEKEGQVDFTKVEKTWDGDDERYIHKFPLRAKLGEDRKVTYFLVEAEVIEGIGVKQVYICRSKVDGGIDGVIELIWLF